MRHVNLALPESATLEACGLLAVDLPGIVAAGTGTLHVDASKVRCFDSTVLALLLHARRLAQEAGRGGICLSGAPTAMLELARLYGVDTLLHFEHADNFS